MKSSPKRIFTAIVSALSLMAVSFGLVACNKTKPGFFSVDAQANILLELNSMNADVGILDYTMASYLVSQNTNQTKDLMIADSIVLEEEQYGVAFRKQSTGLCDKVNSALNALKDTKVAEIATKYGVTDLVLPLDYTPAQDVDNSDWEYIKSKGTFVVGYTLNPPMAMKDGDDLVGFDIELPRAVINYINEQEGTSIEIKFQLIDWDLKEFELSESKTIDCIWNGMTINAKREAQMKISIPYLINRQCVLIRKADKDKYASLDSLKSARIVAERGSTGAEIGEKIFED